jgi:aminopeptidase-like protein
MPDSDYFRRYLSMKAQLENYFDKLWPICRSITGNGLRESLAILNEIIPLEITEIPTGTEVFDWTVPKEWNIRNAWIITPDGRKIADFKNNNLHVVNYAAPVHQKISLAELKKHLHTIESMPSAIPYITSYYRETWGFCLSHEEYAQLSEEGEYEVFIDSELKHGSMTYGECVLPGETKEEVLFSTYVCHPSMANNELSGPLATAFLYQKIAALPQRRFTYRFLFAPETIGVIAFLSKQGTHLLEHLKAGYVLTCCGDSGEFTYKRSKHRTSDADRAAEHVLKHNGFPHRIIEFAVGGSDERQYCSPGFNLPVGSLMRTPYQQYPEYHTSLDNKSFISFDALEKTIHTYFDIIRVLELNDKYRNAIAYCEPQLGKRGLYPSGINPIYDRQELHRRLHFLSFADGNKDLLEIAEWRNESALLYENTIRECREARLI